MDVKKESMTANWSAFWTKEQSERELIGFTFKGPGWYPDKGGNYCLVQPTADPKLFRFYFWSYNPIELFQWIVNAPVHSD